MKTNIFSKTILAVALTAVTLVSCDSDVFDVNGNPFEGSTYVAGDSITSPIAVILDSEPDFTEYVKALRYSGTFSALNHSTVGVSFSAFVPNNDAMRDFYRRRGVDSLENLTPEYVREFVLFHTKRDSISADDFIREESIVNISGESLAISVDSVHPGEASLGNEGHIIQMGISAYNGNIYVLSSALTPLVETVYDRVLESGTSSIMVDAIQASGWAADLQTLSDTIVENGMSTVINRYYTFLNVTDAVFAKAGINSLGDLRSKLSERNDRQDVGADSLLREYVSYHILPSLMPVSNLGDAEGDDLVTKLLETAAMNQTIMLAIDPAATATEAKYTFNHLDEAANLVMASSDVRARNGYVHTLSSWLPVWEPDQTEVIWDLADYAEVRSIVEKQNPALYQPASPVATETTVAINSAACYTFSMAAEMKNGAAAIRYSTCKSYALRAPLAGEITNAYRNDRVLFNLGYMGQVEMKTPTLVRGKYRVEITIGYVNALKFMAQQSQGNGGMLKIAFDGREDATVYTKPYTKINTTAYLTGGFLTTELMEEVEFTETTAHNFQMIVMDPAASTNSSSTIQIDCIRFIPIE